MSEKIEKSLTMEQKDKKIEAEIKKYLGTKEMDWVNKILEGVNVKPVVNPRETLSSKNSPKLLTGTVLDDILGSGGVSARQLVEVYGEYGTGKTQIMFTLAAEASQKGTVIYIDAEYTFSPERIEGILKARGLDVEKFWKNIIVVQPESWRHQFAYIQQLPSKMDLEKDEKEPLQLIIVDSLLALIDVSDDFEGRQNLPLRSRVIRVLMLGKLRQLARSHNCAVMYSNQIQEVPDCKPFMPFYMKQKAKGGPTVSHVPDIRLFLRKSASNTRIARLMDSSELPTGERVYIINEKGIDDVEADLKEKISRASKKEERDEADNDTNTAVEQEEVA